MPSSRASKRRVLFLYHVDNVAANPIRTDLRRFGSVSTPGGGRGLQTRCGTCQTDSSWVRFPSTPAQCDYTIPPYPPNGRLQWTSVFGDCFCACLPAGYLHLRVPRGKCREPAKERPCREH